MVDPQTPQEWVAAVRARLTRIVDERPYVFRDTPRALAEAYQAERKQFVGFAADAIEALEHQLGVHFPPLFRAYLEAMGVEHGMLFWGSDSNPADFSLYRRQAEAILTDDGVTSLLTNRSVVFLLHQGFAFLYFDADAADDAPVWKYVEGDEHPQAIAPSFRQFIEDTLLVFEDENETERAQGGYYVT
ncbi:MAG: SMI1/KNR4 family protein, partial [Anaerolineae bacterium]|nr:SMI1/KNR4 family protein [Anaerolineae bacterium]